MMFQQLVDGLMSEALRSHLADIHAACAKLGDESNGTLNERQRERLREVRVCLLDLEETITWYETPENHNGIDPRVRLLYAARTPLAMIELSTRLLLMAHLRQNEPLTSEQRSGVRAIDVAVRGLLHETERLWSEMQAGN